MSFIKKIFGIRKKVNYSNETTDQMKATNINHEDNKEGSHSSSPQLSTEVEEINDKQKIKFYELYLPTFKDMDSQPIEDDIVSAIALTHTFLTLTYLNPFPFEQDPVFHQMYKVNQQLFKDPKASINYATCENKWRERHNETASELIINMACENRKILEHYQQMKDSNMKLALKPAFHIVDYARHLNNNYVVIRYCHCLLKDKTGILNDMQISDLLMALGANSLLIQYDEGLLYMKSRMSEIKFNR